MNKTSSVYRGQSGLAMPMVIAIVSVAVTTIGYVTVNLLPKLSEAKTKAEEIINYKLFINSLNDYTIHGIREKWCVNNLAIKDGVIETDLLLSNECSSTKTMEQIVTFPGNLERILWDADTIGKDNDPVGRNTIIGLNKQRHLNDKTIPELKASDVGISEINLRLSEKVLENMNDEHPLFIITKPVRKCITSVDIKIKREPTFVIGDDKQLSIAITGNLNKLKLSCRSSVRNVGSTSYYTFYPRRLHTYALIKYGDLKTDYLHEYHGPVYVAGDLILPPGNFDKNLSSIFYNTLTLGVYNEGVTGGKYEAGKIKQNNGDNYTFEERGHPLLSKQDNYVNFRGLLGGLRLDASEDKGIHNLFSSGSSSSADIATLESCIEENQVETKPSYTTGSKLAYVNASSNTSGLFLKLGINNRNRFKPTINAPRILNDSNGSNDKKFKLTTSTKDGTLEIGEIDVNFNSKNTYSFSIAPGSPSVLEVDYDKFGLSKQTLDDALDKLKKVTKSNYKQILPPDNFLNGHDKAKDFRESAEELEEECEDELSEACEDFMETDATCTQPSCSKHSSEINKLEADTEDFKKYLENIRDLISNPATATFELESLKNSDGKTILNKKNLKIVYSSNWAKVLELVHKQLSDNFSVVFTPYHYSFDNLKLKMMQNIKSPSSLKLVRQDTNSSESFNSNGISWTNTYDNKYLLLLEYPKDLVELDCPDGMSLADWNQDMSSSTNFAWNYANTPPGIILEGADHGNLDHLVFVQPSNPDKIPEDGHASSHSKSVIDLCEVPTNRKYVFGFYSCKKLVIASGRSMPLYMIGTFIVKEIENKNTQPVHWHSVWDNKAAGLVLTEYNKADKSCLGVVGKTWGEVIKDTKLKESIKRCSPLDLVSNGPNNFNWTTVDPDVGLLPGHTMTSQKVLRTQRWVIREDSRMDTVK
ncbi:MAG: hypothetical protein ACLGHN_09280 [Bacteriovoracia bacterium]